MQSSFSKGMGVKRLPKMQKVPSLGDVQYLIDQAMTCLGQTVELPWSFAGKDFLLTVATGKRRGDQLPVWTFYGPYQNVEWTYESPDTSLIYNMLLNAVPQDNSSVGTVGNAYASTRQEARTAPRRTQSQKALAQEQVKKGILEGDLANLPISNIFQSITTSALSGRLYVRNPRQEASLWFNEGNLYHCHLGQEAPLEGFYQVMGWNEGSFYFYQNEACDEHSISNRVESLLMLAATLLDYEKYLEQKKITRETFLKSNPVDDKLYGECLLDAVPVDSDLQRQFYEMADGSRNLGELIVALNVVRSQYLPVLFNLVKTTLIAVSERKVKKTSSVARFEIDSFLLSGVTKVMIRQESGINSFGAFLYLAKEELTRFQAHKRPLTLTILRIGVLDQSSQFSTLPELALRQFINLVNSNIRKSDKFCHFQSFDFALVMPETELTGARALLTHIKDNLAQRPLLPELQGKKLALSFGVEALPDNELDGEIDVGQLISLAMSKRTDFVLG